MNIPLRTRVLVADDHTVVRRGLRMVLDAAPDLEVVAEAEDGIEAVELALREDVDLAVLDVAMPRRNGLEAAWRNVLAAAYPSERVPLVGVTAAYAVGVALNAVIPGRGGDAAKIALVRSRVRGSSVATIASTMSVVVLFDLIAATVLVLTVCLTGAVPFAPRLPFTDAAAWAGTHAPLVVAVAACSGAAVAVSARRLRDPLRRLWTAARRGGAILRTPGRYLSRVVVVQAAAWGCRIAVVYCLLAAFGVDATIPRAALVMVLCGASTLVPLTPGGAGTQQVMLAYALSQAATAAVVLSFSIGMQVGITAVNAMLGVAAAMVAFRTLHPVAAARNGLRLVRAGA